MERKNYCVAVLVLHMTVIKMADIVKITDFKPAALYRAVKCFERLEELRIVIKKVQPHSVYSGKHSKYPFPNTTKSGAFAAQNGEEARN
ncbi:hypothetical protein KIN20_024960 [Parelaphostrongylus tenuis]|uniref:Uncharacterized protein n=1 Tax=Parelaphostrongylus tenuis TaxID=148309 RepID=A0AAD5N8R3_PARTN|nr:hypothetical protein KIN20_024960 [Parelaphostrongylus tenuis]